MSARDRIEDYKGMHRRSKRCSGGNMGTQRMTGTYRVYRGDRELN